MNAWLCERLSLVDVFQTVKGLVDALDALNALIDDTPPVEQPARFGNTAYRDWFSKMAQVAQTADSWLIHSRFWCEDQTNRPNQCAAMS